MQEICKGQTLQQLMALCIKPNTQASSQTVIKSPLYSNNSSKDYFMKQSIKTMLNKISNLNKEKNLEIMSSQTRLQEDTELTKNLTNIRQKYHYNSLTSKNIIQRKSIVETQNSKFTSKKNCLQHSQTQLDTYTQTATFDSNIKLFDSSPKKSIKLASSSHSYRQLVTKSRPSSPNKNKNQESSEKFIDTIIDKEFTTNRGHRILLSLVNKTNRNNTIDRMLPPSAPKTKISIQNLRFSKKQKTFMQLLSQPNLVLNRRENGYFQQVMTPNTQTHFHTATQSPQSAIKIKTPQKLIIYNNISPQYLKTRSKLQSAQHGEQDQEENSNLKQWSHQSSIQSN